MGAKHSKDKMLCKEFQNGNIEAVRAPHHSGAGLEQRISATASEHPPLAEDVELNKVIYDSLQSAKATEDIQLDIARAASRQSATVSEDAQLAIAIDASLQAVYEDAQLDIARHASLQSATAPVRPQARESIPLSGAPQQGSLTRDFNGWGNMSGIGGNGWSQPERAEMPINNNGLGVVETRRGRSNIAEGQTTNSVSGPSLPENAYNAHSSIYAPSAPPLPEEYTAGSDDPITYPSAIH